MGQFSFCSLSKFFYFKSSFNVRYFFSYSVSNINFIMLVKLNVFLWNKFKKYKMLRTNCLYNRLTLMKWSRVFFVNRESVVAYADEMRRLGPAKHNPWRTGARRKSSGAK